MAALGPIAAIGGIIAKIADKFLPSREERAAQNQAQVDLNKIEAQKAPSSILHLWRPLLMTVCVGLLVWEVARTVLVTYWPNLMLPPSMLREIMQILFVGLGAA